jgi:acetyl esterase/lipase
VPLDPEVAALLARQANEPPRSSLTVAETRAAYLRSSATAERVPLARVDDLVLDGTLHARQYWPAFDPSLPLLVWLHGGRFFSGSLETHDSLCRALALAGNCRVLGVDYRLAPEHPFPAAVEDSLAAIEWAFSQSRRVGVGGDSAGANLAAVAAVVRNKAAQLPPLRCQLLVYPMLDPSCSFPSHREFATGYGPGSADMLRGWREYLAGNMELRDERVSPLFAESPENLPPALVVTAEYDCLRDEGEEYAARLERAGNQVTLRRYAGAIHGFFQMTGILRLAKTGVREAGAFLRDSWS